MTTTRFSVRLSAQQADYYRQLGAGDISLGVRIASGMEPYSLAQGFAAMEPSDVAALGVRGGNARRKLAARQPRK